MTVIDDGICTNTLDIYLLKTLLDDMLPLFLVQIINVMFFVC